jgi:hypothetical protein
MIWITMLLFIGVTLLFSYLLKLSLDRIGKLVGKVTYERHSAAEEILATGGVPASWRRSTEGPPFAPDLERKLFRRLDELVKYFERAPVFEEEESRAFLLEELRAARVRWGKGEWTSQPAAGSAETEAARPS